MPARHVYEGSCHCGAIHVALELTKPADAVQVRACQCGFCRRHGAMTISDPEGRAVFDVADPALMKRYRFEPKTADFLVCDRCGIYAGAVLEDGGEAWSVVNVAGLAIVEFDGRTPDAADYEAETRDGRIARRKAKWMPTTLRIGATGRPA